MGAVMQRMLARIGKTILKQSQEIQDSHFLTTQLLLIYTGGLGTVGGLCVGAITELNQVRCIKLSTAQPPAQHTAHPPPTLHPPLQWNQARTAINDNKLSLEKPVACIKYPHKL